MSATSQKPQTTKGHCPECNAMRNAHVRACHQVDWHDKEDGVHGSNVYQVLECAGCSTVYFQLEATDDYDSEAQGEREWIPEAGASGAWGYSPKPKLTHYPAETRRQKPIWVTAIGLHDEVLDRLLRELYASLDADLRVLAAIGMRTVFDKTSEYLSVDESLTFQKKLDALVDLGKIGSDEKDHLNDLVNAGSAAAHRGWAPQPKDIDTMMDVIEAFLKRTFVLSESMKKLKAGVPGKKAYGGGEKP